jgi:phage N-6-adenine-methyltransferase
MTVNPGLFTSDKEDYETPRWLFDELNRVFHFTLDAAASPSNAKCGRFYTKADNALIQEWEPSTFLNPPYGAEVKRFVQKAWTESQRGCTVVCLLAARPGPKWFQQWCGRAGAMLWLAGRLRFEGAEDNCAPFDSVLVAFGPEASKLGQVRVAGMLVTEWRMLEDGEGARR